MCVWSNTKVGVTASLNPSLNLFISQRELYMHIIYNVHVTLYDYKYHVSTWSEELWLHTKLDRALSFWIIKLFFIWILLRESNIKIFAVWLVNYTIFQDYKMLIKQCDVKSAICSSLYYMTTNTKLKPHPLYMYET